jgi:2'-5' RNA ligase
MQSNPGPCERINEYALVSYMPGSLGDFLTELRRELVPASVARPHVTVLPPRRLFIPEERAREELEKELIESPPFTVELAGIDYFDTTSVIYIAIGAAWDELRALHERLNHKGLAFAEPYNYHPHVTLAQDFPADQLGHNLKIARDGWARFDGPRSFEVDHLTFVQNTAQNRWCDLADLPLNAVPA